MNLKTTPLLFGLLLGILWLFGLMLVYKKGDVDQNLLLPTMQGPDVKIDTITFAYKEKDRPEHPLVFVEENELWYIKQGGVQVRVENFHMTEIINQIKGIKRYEEERVQNDTGYYGVPPGGQPRITVTLKGKVKERDKEWTLFVGKEGSAGFVVYVNTSDRQGRAYPVVRSSVDSLFFKDTAELRSKRLFDIVEAMVTSVRVVQGKDKLALHKTDDTWRFDEPPLGFAEFAATTVSADDAGKKDKAPATGVKGLINAITALHVDTEQDFEPIGAKPLEEYGVADGKETTMRIVLGSGSEKPAKAKDEKAEKKEREILLIGKRVVQPAGKKKTEEQYYARLLADQGVFRISAKQLDPIKEDVRNPKRIRSHDVVIYDPKKVDAVMVTTWRAGKDDKGKDTSLKTEFKLLHPDDKDWQVVGAGDKTRKGSEKAILALIEALEGKNEIKEFPDDVKDDSWGGLKEANTSEISVFVEGLEKPKNEEKKDDKKAPKKKDEKKDEKETPPTLKKDAKGETVSPFVKIIIGSIDAGKKIAHVKRVLQDGTASYFTVPLAYVEKLHLDQGALAYVDTALPSTPLADVVALDIQRGKEKIALDRATDGKGFDRWMLTDTHDPLGGKSADADKVRKLVKDVTSLTARKWVKKDDLEKYGLKDPSVIVTIHSKKEDRAAMVEMISLLGLLGARSTVLPLPAFGPIVINRLEPPLGDKVTIKFGKEIEEDKEKLVYAEQSGVDLVFLVPADLVKAIRDADLRDRSEVKRTQAKLDATLLGVAAAPTAPLLLASPLSTGLIHDFDPAKVKEVNITLRTRVELRSFTFSRIDKTWVDQSGTKEFTLDTDKVVQLLDKVCKLRTDRFASFGGPTGDSKVTPDEATLQLELKFEDKKRVTVIVGAAFDGMGYFANSSAWREAVFFVPPGLIDPWLQGVSYFGKERAVPGL